MLLSRRNLLGAISLVPMAGLAGCLGVGGQGAITFDVIQGYVRTLQAFVDQLAPIVVKFAPADAAEIQQCQKTIDAAATAFAALSANSADAKSEGQIIYNATLAAIQVAEAITNSLPAGTLPSAVLTAAQVLVIALGAFFGFTPAAAAGRPSPSHVMAQNSFNAAADKLEAANGADRQVKVWLAAPKP